MTFLFSCGQKVKLPHWYFGQFGWISRCFEEHITQKNAYWVAVPLTCRWRYDRLYVSDCQIWRKQFDFTPFWETDLVAAQPEENDIIL